MGKKKAALVSVSDFVGQPSQFERQAKPKLSAYESCELWRNQVMGWQAWWGSQNAEPL